MNSNKNSGIDIDLNNLCSRIAFGWAKKTFENRRNRSGSPCLDADGSFANIMDFNGVRIGISSDGIGTKVELAERTGIYHTLGYDLVAMVADDLVCTGIEPVNFSNILDVDHLDHEIIDRLMHGLHDACAIAGITITGGEIAELGERIHGYGDKMHFNWCATGIGILAPGRPVLDGRHIDENDVVISLRSRGFRSNGFSLVRKIMSERWGPEWHTPVYESEDSWGKVLLTPSLIYTPLIVQLLDAGFAIRGIAHITGGGIVDNFARVLKKKKMGAVLTNLFDPLTFMKMVQELGNVPETIAYRTWNMGNGMLFVVDPRQAEDVIQFILKTDYQAKIAGIIIADEEMIIHTMGCEPQIIRTNLKNRHGKN